MKVKIIVVLIVILAVVGTLIYNSEPAKAPVQKEQSTENIQKNATQNKFNKNRYSLSDPASLWVVVNKHRPLSREKYHPNLIVPNIPKRSNITYDEERVSIQMAPSLKTMLDRAKQSNLTINLQSGYRSYQFQVNLYNRYVSSEGRVEADTFSARPGYSEHQTGLAVDLGGTSNPSCAVAQCFADTKEGRWLAKNAWEYGFILRYPRNKDNITGYEYEPWHFRYVGKYLAKQMRDQNIATLEKFFGLSNAPSYK